MEKIRCIAIEDEPLALKKVANFIEKVSHLTLVGSFDNAISAINFLKSNVVDLIFLDIQMEEFSGIQFLEALPARPDVIIMSAYDKYALKGFELNVKDYLLKPFTFARFIQAVEKVSQPVEKSQLPGPQSTLFFKTEYRLESVRISEILYIEGKSEYLRIVTESKKLMILSNFKSVAELLPAAAFIRVHKSFMVAVDKIESIERNRIKIKNVIIPIGETYKNELMARIA